MKVLLLSNKVPYPANDGSSIAISSMVDGMLKNEAHVSLLSINTRKHFKTEEQIAQEVPAQLSLSQVAANTNPTAMGAAFNLFAGSAYHVSRFYLSSFQAKLIGLLQKEKFDIIQLEGLSMAVYVDIIRKHSTAKITLRAHNVEHQIWERHIANEVDFFQKNYLRIQVKRLRNFEIQTLKKVDGIVAITSEDEKILHNLAPATPISNVPCGIDLNKTTPCTASDNPSVDLGYLASFDWLPNVQGLEWFMQNVWPALKQQKPAIRMKLGGRHMPESFLKRTDANLTVMAEVPHMKDFICDSKVVVIPLLAGSGMRIKVIENMALGKCQVSTTIGAEGIAIKNGYDILLADDADTFAKSILYILENPQQRHTIEQNARHTIEEKYGNALLGKKLLHFYQALL